MRCRQRRAEDQQREHKSAEIPPGSWGDQGCGRAGVPWGALGCPGVPWGALVQCGLYGTSALRERHPLPHPRAAGSPVPARGTRSSLRLLCWPSAASEQCCLVGDGGDNGSCVHRTARAGTQHKASAQSDVSGSPALISVQIFLSPKPSCSPPYTAGVSKPLTPTLLGPGEEAAGMFCTSKCRLPSGCAKKLSAPPNPTQVWNSLCKRHHGKIQGVGFDGKLY